VPSVLVVEDETEMRKFLREILQGENLSVYEAVEGKDALEKTLALKPDLIVLDLRIPKLDGVTFCKAVRADRQAHNIPIIVVTSHTEQERLEESIAAGADDFIGKPFDVDELRSCVRAMLASRHITDPFERAQHYSLKLRELRGGDPPHSP
jgi:DNA-binding response OmpR family regulator